MGRLFVVPRIATVLSALLAGLLAGAVAAQEDQIGARGFEADKVFHVGDVDTVNLYNGNLTITLPLGSPFPVNANLGYGFTAVYNSLIWEIDERLEDQGGTITSYTSPVLSRLWNAGAGWMVSPGRLFPPDDPPENPIDPDSGARWMFVDGSGAKHWFESELSPGTGDGTSLYTRDSTYLRMRQAAGGREIDFPDGRILRFEDEDPGSDEDWRVTEIRDIFGNSVAVVRQTNADDPTIPPSEVWEVYTDDHGRTQRLEFEPDPGTGELRLRAVDLEAFGGTRAVYTLSYQTGQADLCYRNTDPGVSSTESVSVSFLTSITLPDGASYEMLDGALPGYATDCTSDGLSGAIQTLRLPTLGELEWDYGTYFLVRDNGGPNGGTRYAGSSGVVERRQLDRSGTTLGTWEYGQEALVESDGTIGLLDAESRTYVVYPTGDCTTHFFRASPLSRRDMGLPYSSMEGADAGGFFVSTEVWTSHTDAPGAVLPNPKVYCSGETLRTTRVIYDDDGPGNGSGVNRRLAAGRTVYDDDGGRTADTVFSDFDGLGHYRTATTAGTFGAGNARTTTTNYRLFVPAVLSGGIEIPASSSNWVLDTFDRREASEGGETSAVTLCFDSEGFLTRRRSFADTVAPIEEGTSDVVAVFERNASNGNLTDERFYGGDLEPVAIGSELCDLVLPAAESYHFDHRYRQGTRERSRYLDGAGGVVLRLFDHAIDISTGLVQKTTDPAGLETSFTYDALGRLTQELPEAGHGARTVFAYANAAGATPASVTIEKKSNAGATILSTETIEFDALGRVAAEERVLPGGVTSRRETRYNGRGWKTEVSEWEIDPPQNFTQFEGHDPFGRPGTLRSPDGHEVTLAYTGVSQISRTVTVATATDPSGAPVETPATTVERYDRQGRLWRVDEPSGAGGAVVTTTYGYDEANRLASVATTATVGGGPVTQTRTFDYDGRGFLVAETHPEKEGAVTYSNYDARGHAGQKTDTPVDLGFAYDRAERLTTVTDNAASRVMKEYTYATTNSGANLLTGKLERATRHNILAYPNFNNADFEITEVYEYAGTGGRVSKKTTERDGVPWFEQSFSWTELGDPATVVYPSCLIPTECTAGGNPSGQPPRTVTYGYDLSTGFLTSVPGYASSISYHPNQMLAEVVHTNGITDTWAADSDAMRRPGRISTGGVLGGGDFDTGAYTYDGAGNIAAIGADRFTYDGVSRLLTGTALQGASPESSTYDPFGNRIEAMTTQVGFRPIPTDPATNRLLPTPQRDITYDAAGRQTRWGTAAYTYDAFDQMILHEDPDATPPISHSFVYSADDERIVTILNTVPQENWVLRDLDQQVLRRFERLVGDTDWQRDTIRREGTVLAAESVVDGIRHAHLDHLGTIRLWTGPPVGMPLSHNPVHHTYHAFGEAVSAASASANEDLLRFTGHERDESTSGGCSGTVVIDGKVYATAETEEGCDVLRVTNSTVTSTDEVRFRAGERIELGEFVVAEGAVWGAEIDGGISSGVQDLDYMHARYCSPGMGRFLSLDPVGGNKRSAQSWHRYSYALNNPLRFVDPDGRTVVGFYGLGGDSTGGVGRVLDGLVPYMADVGGIQGFYRTDAQRAVEFIRGDRERGLTPIAIFGHSRGAVAALEATRILGGGAGPTTVDLLITIDAAPNRPWINRLVPPNVHTAINFFQTGPRLGGQTIAATDSSKTRVFNVELDATHTGIDEDVSQAVIQFIVDLAVTGRFDELETGLQFVQGQLIRVGAE